LKDDQLRDYPLGRYETPISLMKRITEHVFWIEDTCSAYFIAQGDRALLIDCGTSLVPSSLDKSRTPQVEKLLLTHFHRDQCSSAAEWQKNGTRVVVPFSEKRFLEEADILRASYDLFNNYTSYYPGFTSLTDLFPDHYARDYESIVWKDLRFAVVPLPGHTFGSVGYLFDIDGKRVLACGDLLSDPSKIINYYSAQWRYMEFQGHSNLLESLRLAASLNPDLVLPGHGTPFNPSRPLFSDLTRNLERLFELFHGKPYQYYKPQFRQLTKHVYEVTNSVANSYIIRDDEDHAVLIDCGYMATAPISANPHRFIDNFTPYAEQELGIRIVEWFLPTHYHDDHLAGYPALKSRCGTRVLASPELKDILEHPQCYDMPCLVPEGLTVDRVVARGEPFEWRGVRFFMEQHPGQTFYHHLIWFDVDASRFLSIGDNISGLSFRENRDFIHSFIPKNRTPVSSYSDMPRQILNHSPDVILTGHGGAVPFDRAKVERWRDWMDEWQHRFGKILDQPHPNFGMDPQWVEFCPYKMRIRPGATSTFRVNVTNHEPTDRVCSIVFRSLEGVHLSPRAVDLSVPGKSIAHCMLSVTFPTTFTTHSLPIVADVQWNGKHLGEIAEAIAYW
jgi:glyoxylase-like metal-dependent hydrolase (beta-lactamase superfamily II)